LFIFLFVFFLSPPRAGLVVFDTRCQHPVPLVVSLDQQSPPRFIGFRTFSARLNLVQILNTFCAATGLVCT
jgi:hypothetical protein